ncbi:PREDICTED: uncharacterized protein LOC104605228 [Nelumbo nucifera]|uniref:Uncharacterized protein n=2 Tax=Nelumbo nucifera TaxID=4432 RepID=A0A822XUH9_NELNU|nr:PREDICTED: uncharacterized protein LOC104605228 [Nelumbo nucifera]DAD25284.1 TPA_asm: hypothetical protein HUJ06_026748 [Nelumbo nucifera]DAD44659.1 TPA_asm: hypothetical protein HUJ06_002889 [Nelumbo nucifera]
MPKNGTKVKGEEESPIRSIFCLKKNVPLEEFDEKEDCFILDFDPFETIDLKKLALKDNKKKDEDSQEISVIAERGQVACRDYPHSRHLCVKFPFDKTPHEKYCEQCYCYVCDTIAPCISWIRGAQQGHCHATEHDFIWKNLREMKNRNPPVQKIALQPVV